MAGDPEGDLVSGTTEWEFVALALVLYGLVVAWITRGAGRALRTMGEQQAPETREVKPDPHWDGIEEEE